MVLSQEAGQSAQRRRSLGRLAVGVGPSMAYELGPHARSPRPARVASAPLRLAGLLLLTLGALVVTMAGCTESGTPTSMERTPRGVGDGDSSLVPDLVGLMKAQAEERLVELDLRWTVAGAGPPADNTVIEQSPPPGTPIADVEEVILRVRCVPAPCPSPPAEEEIYDVCTCATRPAT